MLCLARFQISGDRATGALAARALEDLRIENDLIGLIANRVGDSPEGADAWNALGDVDRHSGLNKESIEAYHRAFAHRAKTDLKGKVHDTAGLFGRYADQEDYPRAMEYMGTAYELAHQLGDPHELGYVLTRVSTTIFDFGDVPLAQRLLDEAMATIDEHDDNWCYLMGLRATIDFERGRFQVSELELQRALDIGRAVSHNSVWVRRGTLAQAWIQLQAGELDAASATLATINVDRADPLAKEFGARKAHSLAAIAIERRQFAEALAIIAAVHDAPSAWQAQLAAMRGRALARAGRRQEAEAALRLAIAAVEEQRKAMSIDSLKPWRLTTMRQPFEDLVEVLAAENRAADALAVIQDVTARSVLDGLVEPPASADGSVPDRLKFDAEMVGSLRALLGSARASEVSAVPTAPELAARLGCCTVLTYFRTASAVWLVAMHHGVATAMRIGDLSAVKAAITLWEKAPGQVGPVDALGQLLLPAAALPPPDETIYIAVDEPLQRVSFAALRVDHSYLVERNPVAYVPSASVLALELGRTARGTGAIVIGDPESNLPGAHSEAVEVARTLEVTPVLGHDATRRVALSASDAALLHIAGHTEISARGAALRLADGPLTAGELIDAGRAPYLVVLTSCSSADPFDRAELGPLANAFVAAGAAAVVASRWAVPDDVALEFSRAFYAAGGARDPVRGVARAQRKLIEMGTSPTVWSTFVAIGTVVSPTKKEEH